LLLLLLLLVVAVVVEAANILGTRAPAHEFLFSM